MDFLITFFRDVLDGALYTVISIICGILFCSCIGYLAEVHFNKKKAALEYQNTHTNVSMNTSNSVGSMNIQQNTQSNMQMASQNVTNTTNTFQNNSGVNNPLSNNMGNVNGKQ